MTFKKGNIPWNKGKKVKFSEEHRRNIGKAMKGKKHSEETKRKISEAEMGKKNHFYGRKHTEKSLRKMKEAKVGVNHPMYGKPAWNKGLTVETDLRVKKHTRESIRQMSEVRLGEKNPNWRGGIGKLPYAFDFDMELKELIKKRDGYRCHYPDCGTDIDLMIHHIDYDKQNSDPKNLITLCRGHNSKVNYNREYWEEYFQVEANKFMEMSI